MSDLFHSATGRIHSFRKCWSVHFIKINAGSNNFLVSLDCTVELSVLLSSGEPAWVSRKILLITFHKFQQLGGIVCSNYVGVKFLERLTFHLKAGIKCHVINMVYTYQIQWHKGTGWKRRRTTLLNKHWRFEKSFSNFRCSAAHPWVLNPFIHSKASWILSCIVRAWYN